MRFRENGQNFPLHPAHRRRIVAAGFQAAHFQFSVLAHGKETVGDGNVSNCLDGRKTI